MRIICLQYQVSKLYDIKYDKWGLVDQRKGSFLNTISLTL